MNINKNWITEETEKVSELLRNGETPNSNIGFKIKQKKKEKRQIKNFYITKASADAFDTVVFNQKLKKGKTSPELIEEAIEYLANKYQ
jgi:hypothetical protein